MSFPTLSTRNASNRVFISGPELNDCMGALEEFLLKEIQGFEPEVRPIIEYCFGHAGKRLRPALVFLASGMEEKTPSTELVMLGTVVEMIHLATLIHDDILDNAKHRHGQPTLAVKFGSPASVLAGDALFAHALHLAASFPEVDVCRLVSRATRQVCSGELIQTLQRGQGIPSLNKYLRILEMKTGELFAVSAHLGGLYSKNPDEAGLLGEYGRKLGLAYQIYDDLTDVYSRESEMGKTLGTDLETGKFTLPQILSYQKEGSYPDSPEILASRTDLKEECRSFCAAKIEDATALLLESSLGKEHPLLQLGGLLQQKLSNL